MLPRAILTHMITLKKAIREAKKNKVAVAHFNISEFVTLKACWEAAQELTELQIKNYKRLKS
jgi:fructose/tagatose bisphosphate aldolase